MSAQTYQGGCQCGAVRYEVTTDLDRTFSCNCSRCGRLGTILSFTPKTNFSLLSGADSLTLYQFNTKIIQHQFCKVCGVESFASGQFKRGGGVEMVAVNARCLDGVEPDQLAPTKIDGRSF